MLMMMIVMTMLNLMLAVSYGLSLPKRIRTISKYPSDMMMSMMIVTEVWPRLWEANRVRCSTNLGLAGSRLQQLSASNWV